MAHVLSIKTQELTKRFNSFTAVNHLTFSVSEGEVFGLLGPNGAGKTTTLRMLAAIISPTEGSAQVASYDVVGSPVEVRRSVGILTENPSLYERLSAVENLEFFAQAYGLTNMRKVRDRIRELLDFFGLWGRRDEKIAVYSKGMKQKLAIARALVHDPPIVLLDEPTSGLDPEAAKSIRELIRELSQREKHTVLLSTHRLEDAEKLCNRVMIINNGVSRAIGTPEELRVGMAGTPKLEIKLGEVTDKLVEEVRSMEHVRKVEADPSNGKMVVEADDASSIVPHVVKTLVEAGAMVFKVEVVLPPLEEAYLKLVREA